MMGLPGMDQAAAVGPTVQPEAETLLACEPEPSIALADARCLVPGWHKADSTFRGRGFRAAGLLTVGLVLAAVFAVMASHGAGQQRRIIGQAQGKLEVKKHEKAEACSPQWENCKETKCCKAPGTTCFEKDHKWAMCKPSCDPGPDPADANNQSWSCRPLGPRKKGKFHGDFGHAAQWVAEACSAPGESCAETRCCKQTGMQCFRKNGDWTSCKNLCIPGVDPTDPNETDPNWDCLAMGDRTPGSPDWSAYKSAPWVAKNCSTEHENCIHTGCCQGGGLQCFKKNDDWAQCLRSCHPGPRVTDPDEKDWNCSVMGAPMPGGVPPIGNIWPSVKKNKWVQKKCAASPSKSNNWTGDNCMTSKCCKEDGMQCYSMNQRYGQCLKSCSKYVQFGPNTELTNKEGEKWECKKFGQRHPHRWGWPSLFCFSVFRMQTYEGAIMMNQLSKGIGIFACDEFALFSQEAEVTVGDSPDGELRTQHFDFVPVGVSTDGTAGNTGLFMNVWEAVKNGGKYYLTDWTIKADPDAVLLPERMRTHVAGIPQGGYLQNCPKYAESPLYGAVEAVSRQALQNYFNNEAVCRGMPWGGWGEDKWLTKCLAAMGGQPRMDPGEVGDALCLGQNCGDGKPAYHPLKSVGAWMNCWFQAGR
mmetsp:Transcript_39928/g.115047  ORF Transcript_39928/g.115047 Transcript_39928/m.115047 type:complete len:643 (+) Transcript_39928:60-1988(+)